MRLEAALGTPVMCVLLWYREGNVNKCNECGAVVEMSLANRFYVEMFGTCWNCDRKHWEEGKLSLEEFESRETDANARAVLHLQSCINAKRECNG